MLVFKALNDFYSQKHIWFKFRKVLVTSHFLSSYENFQYLDHSAEASVTTTLNRKHLVIHSHIQITKNWPSYGSNISKLI